MQAQFESIFKELGAAAALGAEAGSGAGAGSSSSSTKPRDVTNAQKVAEDLGANASFQDTIKRTMARMQESGDQATAAAAAEGSEDDFIAEMMKAMKDMPAGADGEEDFSKMLMGMMEQLTNKEILYEPMRELNEKFPGWLEKNASTLKEEDRKRYEEQSRYVKEMVAKFEEPTYRDENVADREYIVDRMQKVSGHVSYDQRRYASWGWRGMLTAYRCKRPARRPRISWAICRLQRRCSTRRTTRAARSSRQQENHNDVTLGCFEHEARFDTKNEDVRLLYMQSICLSVERLPLVIDHTPETTKSMMEAANARQKPRVSKAKHMSLCSTGS